MHWSDLFKGEAGVIYGVPVQWDSLALLVVMAVPVMCFAWQKFNEPSYEASEDDPTSCFKPRHLALQSQFTVMRLFYVAIMVVFYVGLYLLAPVLLPLEQVNYEIPIYVAFLLTGVIPAIPFLDRSELFVRGKLHSLAMIPRGALETANALNQAGFDFGPYKPHLADSTFRSMHKALLGSADAGADQTSLEWRWAVACCVMFRLKYYKNSINAEFFDQQYFRAYKKEFAALKREHNLLERQMVDFRAAGEGAYDVDRLNEDLMDFMDRLFVFVGCAVRLCSKNETKVREALQEMGFRMGKGYQRVPLRHILAKVIAPLIVILLGFIMTYGYWFTADDLRIVKNYDASAAAGVMPGSVSIKNIQNDRDKILKYVPQAPMNAVGWSLLAAISMGVAIAATMSLRAWMLARGRWFAGGMQQRRPWYNYMFCAVGGSVVGMLVLAGISVLGYRSVDAFVPASKWFFLFIFVLYGLLVALDDTWRWKFLPLLEGAGIALCALLGGYLSAIWFMADDGVHAIPGIPDATLASLNSEFVVFMSVLAMLIGLSIGLLLPSSYRKEQEERRYSTIAARRQEIINLLVARLGDTAKAADWLNKGHQAFEGSAPASLLSSTSGFRRIKALIAQDDM